MNTSLSREIRAEMARQDMSRQSLADKAGMSAKSISRYLNNERRLGLDELMNIARALGRPASSLLADAEKSEEAVR